MNPIAIGIDCYTPLTQSQMVTLAQHDVSYLGRYLGYKTQKWTKSLSPDETSNAHANGRRIISIWESNSTHASYFTHERGVSDAKLAAEEATFLHQPSDTAIYFTVDCDAQPSDMNAIKSYFAGVRSAIGSYKVGVYGGYNVLVALRGLVDYYWQTYAWSYGVVFDGVHLLQKQVDTTIANIRVDVNEIYRECGAWPLPSTYHKFDVFVNDKLYYAIDVNDVIYVVWTALNEFGTRNTDLRDGLFNIDGENVQGVVFNGDTYLPWDKLAQHVNADKMWHFTNK